MGCGCILIPIHIPNIEALKMFAPVLFEPTEDLAFAPVVRRIENSLVKEGIGREPLGRNGLEAQPSLILARGVALVDLRDILLWFANVLEAAIPRLLHQQVAPVDELKVEQAMGVSANLM